MPASAIIPIRYSHLEIKRQSKLHAAHRLTVCHLRLVAAILAEGNLLSAATTLNMTQSAETKALQPEAQMGVLLFERTNRGELPTVFGTSLAAQARLILAQIG